MPEYMLASCMPDEISYELPALGHGLSTFCWSVRPLNSDSLVATAHNMPGLAWSIAQGPGGCSFVTGGRQNPIQYDDYELTAAFSSVPVFVNEDSAEPRSRGDWERELRAHRDALYESFAPLRRRGGLNMTVERVERIEGDVEGRR